MNGHRRALQHEVTLVELVDRVLNRGVVLSGDITLSVADVACVTEVYAAREDAVAGVSGKLIVDSLTELKPGAPVGWTPDVADAASFVVRRARAGDLVLSVGAGDVDRVARRVLELLG